MPTETDTVPHLNEGGEHPSTPTGSSRRRSARPRSARPVVVLVERYSLLALLVATVVFFSLYGPSAEIFASRPNVSIVLANQAVLLVVALGCLVPLICGQFDLSFAATVGCSGLVTAAAVANHDLPVLVAVALGVGFGALVGLLNGWLVAYVGINSLIGTLGVSTALHGLAVAYAPSPIIDVPEELTSFGRAQVFELSILIPIVLVIAAVLYYGIDHTPAGRRLLAVGSNPASATLVGISVKRTTCASFVVSGGLAGVAGVLQLCRSGAADSAIGDTFLLPVLAATFLGATAFRPGRFNVVGTLVAICFLAAAVSGLTLSGVQPWIGSVFTGVALVLGVSVSALIRGRNLAT